MDDRTHTYSEVSRSGTRPGLLNQHLGVREARPDRAKDVEADLVAERKQRQARAAVGAPDTEPDGALPFAAPPGATLTL